jgi:hypothetical protein
MGFECEEIAKDIKYNLRSQTEKLEGSTLQNLFGMQGDLTVASRLLKMIDWERKKNKYVIIGTSVGLLVAFILLFVYLKSG